MYPGVGGRRPFSATTQRNKMKTITVNCDDSDNKNNLTDERKSAHVVLKVTLPDLDGVPAYLWLTERWRCREKGGSERERISLDYGYSGFDQNRLNGW